MFKIFLNEITIDKKNFINEFLRKIDTENSELTFTNFFMWRKSYNVRYGIVSDMLVIISQHANDPVTVYFPMEDGDVIAVIDEIISYFEQKNKEFMFRLYDEKQAELLETAYPGRFEITEDTDSFDYVYSIEDLSKLSGKKYHAKRNFVNRFENSYSYSYEKLVSLNKAEVYALFDKWYTEKKESMPGLAESSGAVFELLENWENLDITGGGIRVNGKLAAFSFGEVLNEKSKTVVIHLEHADTSFDGAFPMMNRQFLLNEWQDYSFVNREEDMGLEGLRRAKQSYYPCRMTKKYYAKLK